ncbi:amidophosphoribosyltransferase [Luteococcus japonicus]|uniref:Amidophosphoribosyltransferase n=2 Tax=Luteococcus japonicus TaxID=33984 RepID=A0A1R4KEX9_9ACTN|nr:MULTISPECIES: amidophosphoribosyltransferase [Luteococcus]MDN5562504.1 amidophosphoribosyltransferase [Luteococcus sp.]ROR54153.1 amidophosphoribosyltransferase [Luteococcus japonicus]SJN42752.1 Amidophosphoribosyltransferase [Luteococcus japonicus LSP_Lj1]
MPLRPDGLLTHEIDPHDRGPQDACGVFGVQAPGQEVAKLTYFGLFALQHRGQESAGIAVSNGNRIMVFKDMGLVSQVFDEPTLNTLQGGLAVGHTRYSTTGASIWGNAQPTLAATCDGSLALCHNGNLTNTDELEALLAERIGQDKVPHKKRMDSSSDTMILSALLASYDDHSLEEAALEVLPQLRGAFCLTFMDEGVLYAARDPQGIRPLALGQLPEGAGIVVASETAALDIVGATFLRDVEPGELVTITADGTISSQQFAAPAPKHCLFEYVYLSRPDTLLQGRRIHNVRVKIGKLLAKEFPVDADLVIPTPESGIPAAIGFAAGSGIPYGLGLVRNAYVGRTFIQPSNAMRQMGIRMKLNPLPDVVKGKRIVVVDDTIVRGNTQRQVVAMLRQAGAKEVHVRISAPPVEWPCFYGIDFATRDELIAPGMTIDEIAKSIGADSLGHISLDGLVKATHMPKENLCCACFDGVYPVGDQDLPLADLRNAPLKKKEC